MKMAHHQKCHCLPRLTITAYIFIWNLQVFKVKYQSLNLQTCSLTLSSCHASLVWHNVIIAFAGLQDRTTHHVTCNVQQNNSHQTSSNAMSFYSLPMLRFDTCYYPVLILVTNFHWHQLSHIRKECMKCMVIYFFLNFTTKYVVYELWDRVNYVM